ncbi:MAG: hypothetical protein ABMA25_04125 [Ilumatobacteraceae bacterium]
MTPSPHPLAAVLQAAAGGIFPAADGTVRVLPPFGDVHAVVAFSAHTVLLTDRSPTEIAQRAIDAYGGSLHPDHQQWLAGSLPIGSIDVVLAARASGATSLAPIDSTHPRAERARLHRRDVQVLVDERGLVTIGRGLVGRWELSVELFDDVAPGRGTGRSLIAAGLAAAPDGEWVWAQVAPGNTASLRAFLAAGFTPICSEVLFTHHAD